ncbi:Protein of unknown function [Asanoa hainanensis]|uniref:Apiosidase-like catalytic domain-containing protein n=1 Tax=Asanoa hainanensis TaxID=560556 RepID=A0A239NNU5_9ACTN|nr:DUF4038 domain-containing protein [Asanoa hainanensis]SNT56113.1 Protein of unknown function [Asanoa hainanensis]
MSRLTVDPSGTHLRADGTFFPLVADTAWSTFADASEADWRTYLATRRRQGFTAVQVAAIPILHDRDVRAGAREPFALDADGHHDFSRLDHDYFATARAYTRIAHEEFGLRLVIGVLWNNYLPGTWGAERTPHAVMPPQQRRAYVEKVAETFGDLDPIFAVGGDDHYTVPAANAAYREAIDVLRDKAPHCLLTTHSAPNTTLPDALADHLDLFFHQSGHNVENQELTWRQPAQYLARTPRKPLVASEPPYEQHGKVNGHGRWSREEVRRASWTSVLAGATAGVGYGAHGMWMWHGPGGEFQARALSLEPYPWQVALAFPGALDISLLARLLRDHRMHRLLPAESNGSARVAASQDGDLVAVYLPYADDVDLALDLKEHRLTGWDLAERAPLTPDAVPTAGGTRLRQLPTHGDQLVIAERPPA